MAKKPTQAELINKAKRLGKAGFKAGKKAAAQDPKLLDMLKGRKDDPMTLKILTAWSDAWFEEHRKYTDRLLRKKGIVTPRMKSKR